MSELLPPRLIRARGWLFPAALLALAPKCVLCVLVYAGLGATLGLGGPELCGGTSSITADVIASLFVLTGTAAVIGRMAGCQALAGRIAFAFIGVVRRFRSRFSISAHSRDARRLSDGRRPL